MARYIDENILRMRIREKFHTKFDENDYIDADDLKAVIESIPTADVQEIKHGKWDDTLDGITPYCTICGMSHRGFERTPPYCPHCGARMDGDKE